VKVHRKYNWVNVKTYAETVFWNYSYEFPWAEDMWNILMFDSVVDSSVVAPSGLCDEDIGDILLWLLAMQDLLYDYKVCITHESIHRPEEFRRK
jgi:hypothetical protein